MTDDAPPAAVARFSPGRQIRLTLKEFRETLRDRRTIVTLVLMPLLVYPLLSITFQRLLLGSLPANNDAVVYLIGFENTVDSEYFKLRIGEALQTAAGPSRRDERRPPFFDFRLADDLDQAVRDGSVSLGVRVRWSSSRQLSGRFTLIYRPDVAGVQAVLDVKSLLQSLNETYLRQALSDAGRNVSVPAAVEHVAVQGEQQETPLATLVPLILILMTITGAVYPAIDLTAGERERGTLETLIASPAPRLALLMAKYAAVVTVAVLTATINLLAMTMTLYISGLSALLFGPSGLSLSVMVHVFALLILFAGFFSAVLLSVTSVARSFKEAQAYLIPLMLISIAPGLLSMTPGVELTGILAVVPLVNMVLLARDTFQSAAHPQIAAVAVVSTLLYALAAIWLAARVFGGDAILYGSSRSWSDLVRRPRRSAAAASPATALFCTSLLFPAQFLLGGLIARVGDLTMNARLAASAVATTILFAGLPLLATRLQRIERRSGLRLALPSPWVWPAAILLGISLWPLAHQVYQFGVWLGMASISQQQLQWASELLATWKNVPVWLLVLAIGLAPGICEELFFRGFLLTSLRERFSERATIVASAMLFGAFHLVTPTVLATERLLPSTFIGLVLAWTSLQTGSVLPGMVVHVIHNSMLAIFSQRFSTDWWGISTDASGLTLSPWLLLLAAGGAILSGLVFQGVSVDRRKPHRHVSLG